MAYSPYFPRFIKNSQRKHWLSQPGSPKTDLSKEITSDFTGYFFALGSFLQNSQQNMAYFAEGLSFPSEACFAISSTGRKREIRGELSIVKVRTDNKLKF